MNDEKAVVHGELHHAVRPLPHMQQRAKFLAAICRGDDLTEWGARSIKIEGEFNGSRIIHRGSGNE